MKTTTVNSINASSLIAISLFGYFSSDNPSATAFIPTVIGVLLLSFSIGIKNENKVIAHLAVLLTLLAIAGLTMALLGSIDRSDNTAILRVSIMMMTSILAMITFIRSFIAARKK